MKKHLLMASAILATLTLVGCKSKQNSMQSLYDEATEQDTATAVEEVKPVDASPAPVVSTPAPKDRTERVTTVNDSESGMLKAYNVIVGSFGQMTNAEAMKSKMVSRGYQAFLVRNESGMLRVVAGGYDSRQSAETVRDAIRSNYSNEMGTCAEAWLLIPQR